MLHAKRSVRFSAAPKAPETGNGCQLRLTLSTATLPAPSAPCGIPESSFEIFESQPVGLRNMFAPSETCGTDEVPQGSPLLIGREISLDSVSILGGKTCLQVGSSCCIKTREEGEVWRLHMLQTRFQPRKSLSLVQREKLFRFLQETGGFFFGVCFWK